MSAMASQITGLTIVYSTVNSGADQGKHQSSASLAFVWGIHRSPVNSPHKGSVTGKLFPFDDVIMNFEMHGPVWDKAHKGPVMREAFPCYGFGILSIAILFRLVVNYHFTLQLYWHSYTLIIFFYTFWHCVLNMLLNIRRPVTNFIHASSFIIIV